MGRWAEAEFDRVLNNKIKQLFNACQDPLLESGNVDLRFRTFVRTLDTSDKAIQACFRTLIQQSHLTNVRSRNPNRRPISDFMADIRNAEPPAGSGRTRRDPISIGTDSDSTRSRSPPRRQHTRLLRAERQREVYGGDRAAAAIAALARAGPGTDSTDPSRNSSELYTFGTAPMRIPSRRRTEIAPLLPRMRPSVPVPTAGPASASTSSRPQSPSRMRRLGLDPSAATFIPGAQPRAPSPPSAASRAWLDEYTPAGGPSFLDDDDEAEAEMEAYLSRAPPIRPYRPGTLLGAMRRRRDRNDAEDEEDAAEERRARRRRIDLDVDDEVEAMFGAWAGDEEADEDVSEEDDIDAPFVPRPYAPRTGEAEWEEMESRRERALRPLPGLRDRMRQLQQIRQDGRLAREEDAARDEAEGSGGLEYPLIGEMAEYVRSRRGEGERRRDGLPLSMMSQREMRETTRDTGRRDRRRDGVVIDLSGTEDQVWQHDLFQPELDTERDPLDLIGAPDSGLYNPGAGPGGMEYPYGSSVDWRL